VNKKINYKKETENGEQGNLIRGTGNKGTRKREHENEGENGKGTEVQQESRRESRGRGRERREVRCCLLRISAWFLFFFLALFALSGPFCCFS
jgi:hypothetical protein